MWNEYNQPWSALPRADQGRGVIFIAGVVAVVVVAVDMLRAAGLLKAPARLLRNVLENARVTARSAMKAVKVFVVKNELAVVAGCCSLVVSVIKRGEICNLDVEEALYTGKSDTELVQGSWRGFDVRVVALRPHLQWCVIRYEDLVQCGAVLAAY